MNRKTARSLVRLAVAALGLFPLLAFLAGRRVIVRGESMLPALRAGERVLFDRLAYVIERPRRGDIVLARHPSRPGFQIIKRVAEQEGLGPGEFWLLGDNADESTDSRTLGPFGREQIVARAWVVYWPPERFRVIRRRSRREA
jgi:signal peptidase I